MRNKTIFIDFDLSGLKYSIENFVKAKNIDCLENQSLARCCGFRVIQFDSYKLNISKNNLLYHHKTFTKKA